MRILVVEAVSAGLVEEANSSILSEGFAMLSSLVRDLIKVGHRVSTVVHRSLPRLAEYLRRSHVFTVEEPRLGRLRRLAEQHDVVYVIAPESGGLLARLLEGFDGLHICSSPEAVKQVSDKASMYSKLLRINLRVPRTVVYEPGDRLELDGMKPPFVVKPKSGAGCEGLTLARSVKRLRKILSKTEETILIQELVRGVPSSTSLITDGFTTIPISLNRQFVNISRGMYMGGYTPMRHDLVDEAFKVSTRAVEAFKGLRGYVGIDLVLSSREVYVIEVNPRLTVSYVGLSRALKPSLANAIVEAGLSRLSGFKPEFKALCYFRKTLFRGPVSEALRRLTPLPSWLVAPPIPMEHSDEGYGFLAAVADGFQRARMSYIRLLEELALKTGCSLSW